MKHISLFICLIFFVQISFSQETGSFKDFRDGNVYNTVKIFDQIWMSENLNYQMQGAICFNNQEANAESNGRLYTWEAAVNACPEGWHLPSDDEWKNLEKNLGMNEVLLDKRNFRTAPQTYEAIRTNGSAGLNLTLSGWRSSNRKFYHFYRRGMYWTSSIHRQNEGWFRYIDEHKAIFRRYERKSFSYSVRCISNSNNQQTYINNSTIINDNPEITNTNSEIMLVDNPEIINNELELVDNGKYALSSKEELEEFLKKAIYARNCNEAIIIQNEIERRKHEENNVNIEDEEQNKKLEENNVNIENEELNKNIKENNINKNDEEQNKKLEENKTDEELNNLLEELIEKEDYEEAEKIKKELNELNGAYSNFSIEELTKMEEEAIFNENYEKAKKIRKEIDNRP